MLFEGLKQELAEHTQSSVNRLIRPSRTNNCVSRPNIVHVRSPNMTLIFNVMTHLIKENQRNKESQSQTCVSDETARSYPFVECTTFDGI
jgi:hypothetical protein